MSGFLQKNLKKTQGWLLARKVNIWVCKYNFLLNDINLCWFWKLGLLFVIFWLLGHKLCKYCL